MRIKYRANTWNRDENQSFPLLCECTDKWILNFLCRVLNSPIVTGMASAFSSKQGVLNHRPLPKWSLSKNELWLSLFKQVFLSLPLCSWEPTVGLGTITSALKTAVVVNLWGVQSNPHEQEETLNLACLPTKLQLKSCHVLSGRCEESTACVDGLQCDPQTRNYARKSTVIKENELWLGTLHKSWCYCFISFAYICSRLFWEDVLRSEFLKPITSQWMVLFFLQL